MVLMNHLKIIVIINIVWLFLLYIHTIREKKKNKVMNDTINKYMDGFLLYNRWLMIKNEGKNLALYFEEMGYKNIAIYGLGDIGNRLIEELDNGIITVKYGIDQNLSNVKTNIDLTYSIEEDLPLVDVIVVTPFHAYDKIEQKLKTKIDCPIISIEDIVWSV